MSLCAQDNIKYFFWVWICIPRAFWSVSSILFYLFCVCLWVVMCVNVFENVLMFVLLLYKSFVMMMPLEFKAFLFGMIVFLSSFICLSIFPCVKLNSHHFKDSFCVCSYFLFLSILGICNISLCPMIYLCITVQWHFLLISCVIYFYI